MTPPTRGTTGSILELAGISKAFSHVQALQDVDFDVAEGEVVGIVGDNGAGKSTLVKVLAGVHRPDSGSILFRGEPVVFTSPRDSRAAGIEVVYQDLALAPHLSAVQNLHIGREKTVKGPLGALGILDSAAMARAARAALETYHLDLPDPHVRVQALSGGQQQRIAVVNAVFDESPVVLMDEPTAALGVEPRRRVLDLVRRVRDRGTAVVIISHDLPDLLEVADRIHIMRLGRRVAVLRKEDASLERLVDIMTGVEAQGPVPPKR